MKEISWNNKRRDARYWSSIMILLAVILNASVIVDYSYEIFITRKLRQFLEDSSFFPDGRIEEFTIPALIMYVILCIGIVCIHHVCGYLPDIKMPKRSGVFNYLSKTAVIEDIILGIALELLSVWSVIQLNGSLRYTSIAFWLYIIFFILGSIYYWKSTIIIGKIKDSDEALEESKNYENEMWYCINNCKERVSTFSRVPWKGTIKEIIADEFDLQRKKNIKMESFLYYLIVADCRLEFDDTFISSIEKVMRLPHAHILAIFIGEERENKKISSIFENQEFIKVIKLSGNTYFERINLEEEIGKIQFKNKNVKIHPFRFLENKVLKESYLGICIGPQICREFMKIIMNKLEVLPSIYALFDYIDLQYRLAIAKILDSDEEKQYKFMKEKYKIIGNIATMAKITETQIIKQRKEEKGERILVGEIFNGILTKEDMKIINKYLPNYKSDTSKAVEDTIVYLTSSLRNVLRGHGSFEKVDANVLYSLVFKLAMLNIYLLGTNEMSLIVGQERVWENERNYYRVMEEEKNNPGKSVSPFLIGGKNGNILVFNNRNKGSEMQEQIEYINYLDGTLILPEYINIDVKNKTFCQENQRCIKV